MNRLRLFISVGACSILFSGCWFFTTNEQESAKQKARQESKQEIKQKSCDEALPDELCLRLNEYIQEKSNYDDAYIKARNFKESWQLNWQIGRQLSLEAWEYAKNYDYTVVVGYRTVTGKGGSYDFPEYGTKKCLELDFRDARSCLNTLSTRIERLKLERQ